ASAEQDVSVMACYSTWGARLAVETFDASISPVGGGGLISGIVTGLKRQMQPTVVIGAEPAQANDAARSLRAGELIPNEKEPMSIADGARTISLGNLNWPIIKENVPEIIEVSEEKIKEAVRVYFGSVNLKCEPTGALSLGAILEDPAKFEGRRIC